MTGADLKAWRQSQGWTQQRAACYLGTTKTSVYRWESGYPPVPQTIEILALLLQDKKNIHRVDEYALTVL